MSYSPFQPETRELSDEQLIELAERLCIRNDLRSELVWLLGQLRQMDQRALDLPEPDGILLSAIVNDLDERVSSRLSWLLNAEKHSPMTESALVCHLAT